MVEFLYDYFRDSRKDTAAPADLPRRRGVRRLPDFQRRWFFKQSLETLGRTVPYGRAIVWLTQQDPAYTRGYAEELNEYLERSNFGWIKEQREIGDWLTGRNWSVVKDIVGDFSWSFEVAYNRQGVPKSGAISCYNPSVPDDIGFGSAVAYSGECPGGACDGTYINVPGTIVGSAVQTLKVPTMKHSGGGWYVAGSAMFGPMAPAGYPRFGLKTKVCGPGLFQSWDTTPGKIYYATATREITTLS